MCIFDVKLSGLETDLLQKFISPVHSLNEKEWAAFSSIWSLFACKRKTVLAVAGETERHLINMLNVFPSSRLLIILAYAIRMAKNRHRAFEGHAHLSE